MLLFLITTFFFTLFIKALHLKPLPPWACEMRLLSFWFWKDFSLPFRLAAGPKYIICSSISGKISHLHTTKMMSVNNRTMDLDVEQEAGEKMCLLDLPDLVLECILERISPEGLCNMASVCTSLRDKCTSDHLWERHLKQKWGTIVGPAAYREWQWHIAAARRGPGFIEHEPSNGIVCLMGYLYRLWPRSLVRSYLDNSNNIKGSLLADSIMSWYIALEIGKFWFPAQVYNRENGHVGFILSCYDGELCYDSRTDTFQARYPPHGRRAIAIENGVTWDRLRAPPVDTSPHDLHISDCLNDLHPGDHIEIQWRRNKEFPYGWWYGVVGHLEPCDGNDSYCSCHCDTVVLEFHQYTYGSRWRCTIINRKDHLEEGNETDGFYGGIRKLHTHDEISRWRGLWPMEVLE